MATKTEALAAAKVRWGKKACIEENKRAATKSEREAASARAIEIAALVRANLEQQGKSDAQWSISKLIHAARFVVDVQGGNPSIPTLEAELVKYERWKALEDERTTLKTERGTLPLHSYRWSAGRIGSPIPCFCVEVQADTLEELIEKIKVAR
mgnify:CR=1 FL=1